VDHPSGVSRARLEKPGHQTPTNVRERLGGVTSPRLVMKGGDRPSTAHRSSKLFHPGA